MQGPVTRADLPTRVAAMIDALQQQDAVLRLPPQGFMQTITEGLDPLIARGLVQEGADGLTVADAEIVGFYAAAVAQRVRISDNRIDSIDRSPTSP
jgi:hypothetical protein